MAAVAYLTCRLSGILKKATIGEDLDLKSNLTAHAVFPGAVPPVTAKPPLPSYSRQLIAKEPRTYASANPVSEPDHWDVAVAALSDWGLAKEWELLRLRHFEGHRWINGGWEKDKPENGPNAHMYGLAQAGKKFYEERVRVMKAEAIRADFWVVVQVASEAESQGEAQQ